MTAEDADNLVTFQKVIRSGYRDAAGNLPPEVWAERSVSSTLSPFDLASESRAVDLVAYPMALRGRAGGSACEIGESGDPAFALRAGDGGSSRSQLIAVSVTGDRTRALTAEGHDASEDGTGRGTPIVAVPAIAATLTSGTSSPGVSAPGRRKDDDYNLVAFDPKAGGDHTSSGAFEDGTGITPTRQGARPHAVALHLTQDPVSGPVVPALGGKSGGNGVATETVVRRLTPLECERLQGAPDGWTEGQADSPRYRQLGNAVAVPVFEWVGRRLSEVDATLTACRYTQYPEVTSCSASANRPCPWFVAAGRGLTWSNCEVAARRLSQGVLDFGGEAS